MRIKNISKGPRGLNTKQGHRWLEVGEEADVEMTDADAAVSRNTGWFEGFGKSATKSEDVVDRDDLKKQAEELGIEYAPNITTPKLKELVDAKLAE